MASTRPRPASLYREMLSLTLLLIVFGVVLIGGAVVVSGWLESRDTTPVETTRDPNTNDIGASGDGCNDCSHDIDNHNACVDHNHRGSDDSDDTSPSRRACQYHGDRAELDRYERHGGAADEPTRRPWLSDARA